MHFYIVKAGLGNLGETLPTLGETLMTGNHGIQSFLQHKYNDFVKYMHFYSVKLTCANKRMHFYSIFTSCKQYVYRIYAFLHHKSDVCKQTYAFLHT